MTRLPGLNRQRLSHPSRGAWIEMNRWASTTITGSSSHPSRGAWIEMNPGNPYSPWTRSHPSRGAWIEIYPIGCTLNRLNVAPLTGCVD